MLVLSRKRGETIHIGDDIVITVTEFRFGREGSRVRIGIDAPPSVAILRGELRERDKVEQAARVEAVD